MSKYKAILDGVIATLLKGSEKQKEVADALTSDEESLDTSTVISSILDADKERVKAIKTSSFDDGHKKAKGEALSAVEKKLREKYGVDDSSLQGEDLIAHIIEANSKKSDKQLDEDGVKRSKAYISLQEQLKKQMEDLKKEYEDKLQAQEKSYLKEKTFQTVSDKALAIFESLNPILSDDAAKAAKQRQIILNELKGFEFEEQDGKIIVLKDGKVYEDDHGHMVAFENLVKDVSSQYFDFKAATEGRDAPNGGKKPEAGSGGKGKYSGKWPANEQEYFNLLDDQSIALADRVALKDAWAESQKKAS